MIADRKDRMDSYVQQNIEKLQTTTMGVTINNESTTTEGVQWLDGRVLDSRPKGRGFEPHRRHCVVSLSKNIDPSL